MLQELVITIGARPHARCLTLGQAREWISALPDDDLAEVRVWRVPTTDNLEPSTDATPALVADWAQRIEQATRPGLRPSYPAFVAMHMPKPKLHTVGGANG